MPPEEPTRRQRPASPRPPRAVVESARRQGGRRHRAGHLVVGGAALIVMSLRAQQAYLTAEVVRGAAQFSDTIKAQHLPLHAERRARRTPTGRWRRSAGSEGIEQVRIFNKEGRVTFSTDRAEIGRLVDKRAEACYACHAAGQPLVRLNVPSRSRIFTRNGHRVLGDDHADLQRAELLDRARATPTRPTSGARRRGHRDVARGRGPRGGRTRAHARRCFSALGILLLAVGGRPVRRAAASSGRSARSSPATERVAQGDLDHPIRMRRTDEIGRLARVVQRDDGARCSRRAPSCSS